MDEKASTAQLAAEHLLDLYPRALPAVYGFLCNRCGDTMLAEDLTAEAFVDAVRAVQKGTGDEITVGWLIVVARRRLVDHWRHQAVEERHLQRVGQEAVDAVDPWDEHLDVVRTRAALERLGPHHRAALMPSSPRCFATVPRRTPWPSTHRLPPPPSPSPCRVTTPAG